MNDFSDLKRIIDEIRNEKADHIIIDALRQNATGQFKISDHEYSTKLACDLYNIQGELKGSIFSIWLSADQANKISVILSEHIYVYNHRRLEELNNYLDLVRKEIVLLEVRLNEMCNNTAEENGLIMKFQYRLNSLSLHQHEYLKQISLVTNQMRY